MNRTSAMPNFEIPEEWVRAISEWQSGLPHSDGLGWRARYEFCFRDDGMATYLKVKDAVSGTELNLFPDPETI